MSYSVYMEKFMKGYGDVVTFESSFLWFCFVVAVVCICICIYIFNTIFNEAKLFKGNVK